MINTKFKLRLPLRKWKGDTGERYTELTIIQSFFKKKKKRTITRKPKMLKFDKGKWEDVGYIIF